MKQGAKPPDNVVELFAAIEAAEVPPLSNDEVLLLRRMIREFAIIRAACPMAVRALSTRE